jgi:Na+/H+ antiporter NhaD/arsenite permease-like protein
MFRELAAAAIFLLAYAGVALGRFPGLRIDRAGIALTGGAAMIAIGAISPAEAYRAIDLDTLALLLGMMIVVGHLRLSGFFRLGASWALQHAHSQPVLLVAVALTSGVLSAFLVNDAVCLVMAPLVIETTRALKRDPVPYLLATAMASNVGSAATITGNPQNMIIGAGSASEFYPLARLGAGGARARVNKPQMVKALLVTGLVIGLFFFGAPVGEAAMIGGALLLVTRSIKAQKVYREIDGSLLMLFAGLFVVVAGVEKTLLSSDVIAAARALHLENAWILTAIVAALSNVISNVPAVLAVKPFLQGLADPERAWLVVAMSSTFAGNLTLVGSVANLIVAEKARQEGIELSFWRYARIGVPLTLLTLALGAWRLS